MSSPIEEIKNILSKQSPEPEALRLIPETLARKHVAIPLAIEGNILRVAMANPSDILALEALASWSQMRIETEAATQEEVLEAIDFNYKNYEEIEKQISNITLAEVAKADKQIIIDPNTEAAPVAHALTLIIDEAVKARASDVHLHPGEDILRVRFRIDGTLQDMFSLPLTTMTQLISRIKIMGKMNIADHHRPQDGQFSVKAKGRLIDIRVSIIATVYGEMAVLRLLDKSTATLNLTELGFLPESLATYENMLKVPYGVILVSGPTGAGKTTTLYASLNSLDQTSRNIITVEDPVEYRFSNINQIQVNTRAGITFASGLRSILRLDPDVILIGEIRDAETANIAIQSALTGHLVLSSIHANDSVGVVLRLLDLGVEPFLVSSALIGVVAQRMARRICSHCAQVSKASPEETMIYAQEMGEEKEEFMQGTGCKSCSNSGYRGRTGIFEILVNNDNIKSLLLKEASASELRAQAIEDGMVTLVKDGMKKVKKNVTTPAEVMRNAYTVV
ncbi:MAG: type II/IV secretion system protein [Dehalococcoidales bacterium]|nr:type II/IV secretion system protein [Dehalococcoidales bacterium]